MKKINFRPIFYGLISFCFALIFARQIFSLSVFHIIFVACCIATILTLCIRYKCLKRFVLLSLIFVIGTGYYFLGFYSFGTKDYSDKVLLEARIGNLTTHVGYSSIILDNIKINGANKSFNIQASYSGELDFEQGDIIVFETKLTKVELFDKDGFNSYYYKNNTPYKTTIKSGSYILKDGYVRFDEQVRNNFNNFVEDNFSKDVAPIVGSVIVGDKSNLDNDVKSAFSNSGLGHLLAISGLHIGFIVSLINWIIDKTNANKKICFIVLAMLLIFYCYICNFAPSVTRACLMSIIFMLSQLVYRRYDRLNCLSLCAWIILFAKPLYIFDAGFLLSFTSVFCIFALTRPLYKQLRKLKLKKLASPLALILSVQLGLIPVMSLYYQSINIFSILANLVCVPLFEVVFILTFILIPICMLLPFLAFVLKFIEFLYFILTAIAGFVASLSWANISLTKSKDIFCVGFYTSAFVCSRYVNIERKTKYISIACILGVAIVCSIFV